MKNSIGQSIRSIAMIVLGNFILALSIKLFVIPTGLITGGATGIALAINHYTDLSVSLILLLINILMLIAGLIFLGKRFAVTTILSSLIYPGALELFDKLIGDNILSSDKLLCAIFAGIGTGLALGIVFREGASTGGMDVPPFILNKYLKLNLSLCMYAFDACIILLQMLYRQPAEILYGILSIIIYTIFMDKILVKGSSKTELKIISKKYDEIRQALVKELDRTVTMIDASGGYSNNETQIVLSVISNRELARAEKIILDIDPLSFIVITRVSEVKGRGFSLDKDYPEEV